MESQNARLREATEKHTGCTESKVNLVTPFVVVFDSLEHAVVVADGSHALDDFADNVVLDRGSVSFTAFLDEPWTLHFGLDDLDDFVRKKTGGLPVANGLSSRFSAVVNWECKSTHLRVPP